MKIWYPCYIKKIFEIDALYTAFERFTDSSFNFKGESHNFYELVCVLSGTVGVASGNKVYNLKRGSIAIHPPHQFHRIWAVGETKPNFLIISFSAKTSLRLDGIYYADEKITTTLYNILSILKDCCDFNKEQITKIKSGCEIKIQNAVRMLENIVCDISEKTNNNLISYNNSRTALAYAQIVTCLEENCTKPLTVSQIAKLCNISDSALKQTFKKYSGIGIMEYFNNIKINRAIGMLYAGASIKEISQNLGFCDPNYFSTVFKRITGVSPKKYINGQK